MMPTAARLDQWPTPLWIALLILGFIFWWPLGLVMLAVILWSGRMGCCGIGFGRWNDRAEPVRQPQDRWRRPHQTGNRAFDEYRADALRRLEEEQREFQHFLDRLRTAKDKAEFEQFMAERSRQSQIVPQPRG
jgi:Protein of unknown function (DUF2852)